jgi:hypothetical protein
MKKRTSDTMTDKERILLALIKAISFETRSAETLREQHFPKAERFSHLAGYGAGRAKVGDVVIAETGRLNPWSVGIVRDIRSDSEMLVQEIGGPRLCWVGNESFSKFVNIHPESLRWGREAEFERRVRKAIARHKDSYIYRFGGVDFAGETATVWIREAFGGFGRQSAPFAVEFPKGWHRLSGKAITAALEAAGFGTRKFDEYQWVQRA